MRMGSFLLLFVFFASTNCGVVQEKFWDFKAGKLSFLSDEVIKIKTMPTHTSCVMLCMYRNLGNCNSISYQKSTRQCYLLNKNLGTTEDGDGDLDWVSVVPDARKNLCHGVPDKLLLEEDMQISDYLCSLQATKIFEVQSDGNLCVRNITGEATVVFSNTPIWCSMTHGKNCHTLKLNADGSLKLMCGTNQVVRWAADFPRNLKRCAVDGSGEEVNSNVAKLVLEESGELIKYRQDGSPEWSNLNICTGKPNSFFRGFRLHKNQIMCDLTHTYQFYINVTEGAKLKNISTGQIIWENTDSSSYLQLQYDGNFVCLNKRWVKNWASNVGGVGLCRLDSSGRLVLRNFADTITKWSRP